MGKRPHWTEERREELEHRWHSGERDLDIRQAMGLTRGQLAGRKRAYHLHTRPGRPINYRADNSYVREGRTRYPHKVVDDGVAMKSGANSPKLGAVVLKGAWSGFPIFSLTLEERATCPRSCALWVNCYGGGMMFAKRFRHGEALEHKIWRELGDLQQQNPKGFVVRLHVLGDFWSPGCVMLWEEALQAFPALHVFGYSAWPHKTAIGAAVTRLRDRHWSRFAVRTSGADCGPRTVVIENEAAKPAGAVICPAQTNKTATCGSCALCWSPAAKGKVVAFLRH